MGKFWRGNFWQIITADAIGQENFGKSAGSLSVIPLYLYYIGEENLANCIPMITKFTKFTKIFPHTVSGFPNLNKIVYNFGLTHFQIW